MIQAGCDRTGCAVTVRRAPSVPAGAYSTLEKRMVPRWIGSETSVQSAVPRTSMYVRRALHSDVSPPHLLRNRGKISELFREIKGSSMHFSPGSRSALYSCSTEQLCAPDVRCNLCKIALLQVLLRTSPKTARAPESSLPFHPIPPLPGLLHGATLRLPLHPFETPFFVPPDIAPPSPSRRITHLYARTPFALI